MSEYDRPSIMQEVCERIAKGESLRKICEPDDKPAPSTICLWLSEDASFAEHYARARERQADHYAEEIIEIADTEEDPQRGRLRVDARKWVASKLAPKRYGEKQDVQLSGHLSYSKVEREIVRPPHSDG